MKLIYRLGKGALGLTTLQTFRVIQPGGSVALAGTYIGTPTTIGAIQGRWGSGTWTQVAASVSAGAWSGTLTGCVAGQTRLQVRSAANTLLQASTIVKIGDLFAGAGQSNMVGQCTELLYTTARTAGQLMLADGVTWNELITRGFMPTVADALLADQGTTCGYIPCAVGNTEIAEWVPGQAYYTTLLAHIATAGGCKCVLFWLGENDIAAETPEATFNAALDSIADGVYAATGAKLMVCTIETWAGQNATGFANVNNAITTAWADNAHVLAGPDLSAVVPSDPPHFVTPVEIAAVGALWWAAIKAAFYP